MPLPTSAAPQRLRDRVVPILTGPPVLAFLPALTLGAYWLGGEPALLLTSLGIPLVFAMTGALSRQPEPPAADKDRATGLMLRDGLDRVLEHVHERTGAGGGSSRHASCWT